jgi:hypothetical protein
MARTERSRSVDGGWFQPSSRRVGSAHQLGFQLMNIYVTLLTSGN